MSHIINYNGALKKTNEISEFMSSFIERDIFNLLDKKFSDRQETLVELIPNLNCKLHE